MTSFLPHQDQDPEARRKDLVEARNRYQFKHDTYVSPLAFCKKVPVRDTIMPRWLLKVGKSALRVLANRLELEAEPRIRDEHRARHEEFKNKIATGRFDLNEILDYLKESLRKATVERPGSLDDYADLFRKIGLPPISRDFQQDRVFAWMRVAGPNPVMLERVSELPDHFPVTAEMFASAMPKDSLDAAAAEGRLYMVDCQALDGSHGGTFDGLQKYIYAPLALFSVDKTTRDLMPVAIQCEQRPSADNPIFTPRDGYNWLIAKTIVEVADADFHQAVTHLGRTHLFIEPFVVTTHRQLSERHPLYRLLVPHFEGTLRINGRAAENLIAPGEIVDQVLGPTIETVWSLVVKAVQGQLVDKILLPDTFARRGVDDPDLLPKYPYRDDAMLYWNAIRQWVANYLSIYYHSDADVAQDNEVAAWFQELVAENGGRIKGINSDIGSLNYLTDVLTLVIYTSSCQHAAVNFPQYDLMSYVPNFPGACYKPRPTRVSGAIEQDYLDTLPPLNQAQAQMDTAYLLGSVFYTHLGNYGRWHFRDRRVMTPLKTFKEDIRNIGDVIRQRNRERRPYKFLLPSGIPQSINI